MKKILVGLLFLSSAAFGSYDQMRNYFKQDLCVAQAGLMEREQYMAFIEPYMKEAEETLVTVKHCMENSESHECRHYFSYLKRYNVAYFNNYAMPDGFNAANLEIAEKNLAEQIELLKKAFKLKDLNTEQELSKTKDLFARANHAFYKALSTKIKAQIAVARLLNGN